jgi:hypothetical protein
MDGEKNSRKFRRGSIVALTAEMIYQLTGSNMSSPQTAHLNAKARSDTIGFWVKLTQWEAFAWTGFFWWLYGSPWALVGGLLAWSGMWGKYRYAIQKGLSEGGEPTENYQDANAPYTGRRRMRG